MVIFSQFHFTLSVIEDFIIWRFGRFTHYRLDGSTPLARRKYEMERYGLWVTYEMVRYGSWFMGYNCPGYGVARVHIPGEGGEEVSVRATVARGLFVNYLFLKKGA